VANLKKNKFKTAKYRFPRNWQRKLLSLLIANGTQIIVEDLVKSEYFERPVHAQIAEVVINLYKEYGVPLTFSAVREALREQVPEDDFPRIEKALKSLRVPLKEVEEKLITDQVRRFAQHQAAKSAAFASRDLIEQDQIEELETMWSQAFRVGKQDKTGIERFYFSSFAERAKKRQERPDILLTLIKPLDRNLNDGGFARKELNVFLALPSGGKSFALDHMAKAAIIQKKKTIFYTLEMSWERVAGRLDASFSGVEIRELRGSTSKVSKKLSTLEKQFGDSLLIKEYPANLVTVATIRSHIISSKMMGFEPEVIIIDYINLLSRDPTIEGSYKGLGDVYIQLRSLAQEFNLWCITAGQSNRSGFDSEVITMKDIGESFEGAMHSDVLLTLNRTEAERQGNMMRIYIAKNRNELDSIFIKIQTNFKKGALFKR